MCVCISNDMKYIINGNIINDIGNDVLLLY